MQQTIGVAYVFLDDIKFWIEARYTILAGATIARKHRDEALLEHVVEEVLIPDEW